MRRFSSKELTAAGLALVALLAPTTARGGDQDEALIHSALELRREHHDVEALAIFRLAFGLRPSPRARAQIGLAEQSLGQWLDAESDLRAALAADDPWIARNREQLEQALAFTSTHLGWLLVSSNVPALLELDGKNAGALPMAVPARVPLGNMAIRVKAEGYVPLERTVDIDDRGTVRESVELANSPAVEPSPDKVRTMPANGQRITPPFIRRSRPFPWLPVALSSSGLAELAVGSAFGVAALVDKGARDEHCKASVCDPKGLSLDAEGREAALASTIAFGIGAPSLLAGAWLLVRAMAAPIPFDLVPAATSRVTGITAIVPW